MNELVILVISLTFFIILYTFFQKTSDLIYVKSSVDGKKYLVQNFKDGEDAANLMSQLVNRLDKCSRVLLRKHPNNDAIINIIDIINIVNTILNSSMLDPYPQYASDVNSDNIINVSDIIAIVNIIIN